MSNFPQRQANASLRGTPPFGGLQLDAQGDLVLHTSGGAVTQQAPVAYQVNANGGRGTVAASFVLGAGGQVGFQVGSYDASRPLYIDPVVSYATYLGGSNTDTGSGIAVDSSGNAYLVGTTASTNFPLKNPYQSTPPTYQTVFVSKLNAAGSALVYSTYLGNTTANMGNLGNAIAVDSSGDAYITGQALDSSYPTTAGAFQTTLAGVPDAFVTKLSAAGNALVYSTFLGGSGNDVGHAIAVNGSGNAYVTGNTSSTDFPTAHAYQSSLQGTQDAFVSEFNSSGSGLVFSTYLGDGGTDAGWGIAVDPSGRIDVTGDTSASNFPTVNALQGSFGGGGQDAFITQFNSSGTALDFSTYWGGSGSDQGDAITTDANGNLYVTGWTSSSNFPTSTGAFQRTLGGTQNAFVSELTSSGGEVFSTYLGGNGSDSGNGIAVDANGHIDVTGSTTSNNFPTASAWQSTLVGGSNAFVTQLQPDGGSLGFSSYEGGGGDAGSGIATDSNRNVYIIGSTTSTSFPTVNPFQPSNAGGQDVFVAKIAVSTSPPSLTNPGNQTDVVGAQVGLAISASDPDGDTLSYSATGLPPGLTINTASGYISGTIANGATSGSPYTVTVIVSDGTNNASQTFQWAIKYIALSNPGDQSNLDSDTVSLPLTAKDALGQSLTYTATGLPPGLSINSSTGVISGTIAATAGTSSPYAATVTVSDGTYQASQSFSWYVSQPPAPSLDLPSDQVNAAGDAVLLQLTGTGSSEAPLTYSATGLPQGLSINASTGLISGTIASAAAGATPYQVTATVSDGTNTDSQTFQWTVNYVGLSNPGYQFNNDGDVVSLTLYGDGSSTTLTYTATGLPPGLSINLSTGVISGTISATADSGSPYDSTVTISDGTHQASQSFLWYVGQPPVLSLDPPGNQVNAAGDAVSLQLTATDWNTPLLTYSATGLPDGLSINATTGLISGTIANDAASTTPHQVTASVSDGTNSVSQSFQWTVNFVGLTAPGDQFNNDGETVSLPMVANDASGLPLTYTATGLPTGLTINSSTGVISGTIAATADTSSPYAASVTASDGTNQASQSFSWYVGSQPTLALDPPGNQVNPAGEVVALQLSAEDATTATLTYSATGLPDGLSIDPSTGIISGTIANDAASTTPYQVTATVSDGTNRVSQTFQWAVNYINLDNPGDQNNLDTDVVSLSVTATDASGLAVSYSATGLPPGLSINPNTGLISGTITATADTSSPYNTTVIATDGMYSASESFAWDVSPQPALTLAEPGDKVNAAGDVVSVQLAATDAAGKPVTYTVTGLPAGLSVNSSTGLISGTVAASAVSNTPYVVTATASDGTNSASQTFGWRVTAQGAPQMDVPGDTLATAEPIQFDSSGMAQVGEAIGDNSYGNLDVDLYAVQMAAGDQVTLTNEASAATANNDANFGIALRVFNASGNELSNAGEGVGLEDGDTLTFTAPSSGTYYIGVSYYGNTTYNPQVAGSGTAGLTGAYAMAFSYAPAQEKVAEQWKVTRDPRREWAVVQSLNPAKDTIAGLAKLIGLEPAQAAKWLTWDDPSKPSSRTAEQEQAIINALADPTKTVAQIFPGQTQFWVPNTVIAYWGGEGSNLGRYWVKWNDDLVALTKKGYHVLPKGYETKARVVVTPPTADTEAAWIEWQQRYATAVWQSGLKVGWKEAPMKTEEFLKQITDRTQANSKSLLGTVLWGHGGTLPPGFLLNAKVKSQQEADKYYVPYDTWAKEQSYKLGLGILYACSTANARSQDRIDKGTNVFSTNAIFWGADKTLVPPLCMPAVEKVLRQFKEIKIGDTTFRPPNVQAILNMHKEVK